MNKPEMDIGKELLSVDRKNYGDKYNDHLLEMYKTYLEMADHISDRRQNTNNYFLALDTAILGLMGYLKITTTGKFDILKDQFWLINIAGIVLCYIWYRIVRSYKDLNSGKFKVVHQIERLLPIRPFDAEWTAVGRGRDAKRYLPFTHLEIRVPFIFMVLNAVMVVLYILGR